MYIFCCHSTYIQLIITNTVMSKFVQLTTVLCLSLLCSSQKLEWEKQIVLGAESPAPRGDAAMGYDHITQRLFIFGGRDGKKIFNDTWYYDFISNKWNEIKTSTYTPEKRFTIVSGVFERKLYITTGEGPEKVFYNDVWMFDFTTLEWLKLAESSNAPKKRYGAAGGIYPGQSLLWMSHGFAKIRYSNTFTYDILRNQWVEEFTGTSSYNPSFPHARCVQGSAPVSPDHLLIYGGCLGGGETGGPCPSADTWLFNRVNKKWKRLSECLSPRMFPAIAVLPLGQKKNNLKYRAVMFGGGQNRPIEDTDEMSIVQVDEAEPYELGIFKLDKNDELDLEPDVEWQQKRVFNESNVPSWRMGHNMITVDSLVRKGILMFGGKAGDDHLNDIWLLKGDADGADDLDFIGDGCHSKYWSLIHFHALFMFIAWGLCFVLGVFFARYFRAKDPLWFRLHIVFQILGFLFSCGGFICGVMSVPFDHFKFGHGGIGLALVVISFLQIFGGLIRPHLSTDQTKSKVRKIWEYFHKFFGHRGVVLGLINISLGMFLAVVPTPVYAVWFAYLGLWLLIFFVMDIIKCHKECGKNVKPTTSGSYELDRKM